MPAAVSLADVDDADRERHPRADAVGHAPAPAVGWWRQIDPHQFRRTAADIEEDDAGSGRIDQRGAAGDREPRFGLARHNLEGEAGLVPDAGDEFLAVLGSAAGLGGDHAGAADVSFGKLAAAHLQRLDGARHRRLAQAAVGADPLAEAHDPRECVDDAEAMIARRGDEEAAVVGAEIEGAIERPLTVEGALAGGRRRQRYLGVGGLFLRRVRIGATRKDGPTPAAAPLPRLPTHHAGSRLAGLRRSHFGRRVSGDRCFARVTGGHIRAMRIVARRQFQSPCRRSAVRTAKTRGGGVLRKFLFRRSVYQRGNARQARRPRSPNTVRFIALRSGRWLPFLNT